MTVLEDIARWVAGLSCDDIPERVREVARNQLVSVLGAMHAGAGCAGGRAVIETARYLGAEGPCSSYPGGERRALDQALLQNCGLSMALDYDDYLFLAHTGHSAVCVPMAVGEMVGADTDTVLAAQVAANEIAGRLGGSVVLGPHNGQMWAHVHLLGAAAAASKVLGLDEEQTANALGIAMTEPVYALFPGFMGPQSKLLIAATPAITGTTAAFLASNGMTGSRRIIEDPQGFWAHFSFVPLPFMMTGLGRSWVTDTIAFKLYPGCAYIDTAMDALFDIRDTIKRDSWPDVDAGVLDPKRVKRVRVEASLLTTAMDAMSHGYMDPAKLSPTNINFSLSVSIAIGLLAGELTGAELTEEFLDGNREEILILASRVELTHSAPLTVRFLRAIDDAIDLGAALSQLDLKLLSGARHRLGEHLSGVAAMGRREALEAWKSLSPTDRAYLRGLFSLRGLLGKAPAYDLGSASFEELQMPFGARVTVELDDGSVHESEKLIPRGAPGDPYRFSVPESKFLREASGLMGVKGAREAVAVLRSFEEHSLADVHECMASRLGSPEVK